MSSVIEWYDMRELLQKEGLWKPLYEGLDTPEIRRLVRENLGFNRWRDEGVQLDFLDVLDASLEECC